MPESVGDWSGYQEREIRQKRTSAHSVGSNSSAKRDVFDRVWEIRRGIGDRCDVVQALGVATKSQVGAIWVWHNLLLRVMRRES